MITILGGREGLHGDDFVAELVKMENRPWGEWGRRNPKPISKRQIAVLLNPFGISPGQLKIGGLNKNGYTLEALQRILARYSRTETVSRAEGGAPTSTPLHLLQDNGLPGKQTSTVEDAVEFENPSNSLPGNECRGVELGIPPSRPPHEHDGDRFAALKDLALKLQPKKDD